MELAQIGLCMNIGWMIENVTLPLQACRFNFILTFLPSFPFLFLLNYFKYIVINLLVNIYIFSGCICTLSCIQEEFEHPKNWR